MLLRCAYLKSRSTAKNSTSKEWEKTLVCNSTTTLADTFIVKRVKVINIGVPVQTD